MLTDLQNIEALNSTINYKPFFLIDTVNIDTNAHKTQVQ